MSRFLALPLIAIVLALLACGTNATEALQSSPPTQIPSTTSTLIPEARIPRTAIGTTAVPGLTPLLETTQSSPTSDPTPAPTHAPAPAMAIRDQPEVGTDVGKTVPNFEFKLADGTTHSTAQLASQGRPVFFFFHATW